MADNPDRDLYKSLFDREAAKIGTSAAERNFSEELARQREAARIQRQTAGASYAEMYQRAQGQMSRGAMAGTAPGLTGGMATQRSSELEGAQMRALGSISGQREQAMREIDYQELMAPRQAFEFAQQQAMAQREEQMFNLQMISSRQEILNSDMSDEDKIEALTNTGISLEDAKAQIEDSSKSWFKKLIEGDSPLMSSLAFGGTGLAASRLGTDLATSASLAKWSGEVGGFAKAFKLTKSGKFLLGTGAKAGKFKFLGALGPIGLKIGVALLVGYGAHKFLQWAMDRN